MGKKKKTDWSRCGICKKIFVVNETKTMRPSEDFFRCQACDSKE